MSSYFNGKLLVATPQMNDPRFNEAVILLCGHDADGAMGIMLNKPLDSISIQDIIEQFELEFNEEDLTNTPVLFGGPVEIGRGFVVHSRDFDYDSSLAVTPEVALSSSSEVILDCLNHKGPDRFLFSLGYCGWSAGQLETEVKSNSWLVLPAPCDLIFNQHYDQLWDQALLENGIRAEWLSNQLGHA